MIELVIVIVILGILAAVALPKFVDLKDDARRASLISIAGTIKSASATNYAAKLAGKPSAITVNQANVCTTAILGSLLTGGMPAGYSAIGPYVGDCSNTLVDVAGCEITDAQGGITATVGVVCAR